MKLLTVPECAEFLRRAKHSVQSDTSRNPSNLPIFAKLGGKIVFDFDDIVSFVNQRKNIVTANDTKFIDHTHKNSVNKKRGRPRKALTRSAQAGGAI